MVYNTTTIPTQYTPTFLTSVCLLGQLFFVFGSILAGTVIGAFGVHSYFKTDTDKDKETDTDTDTEDTDTDTDEDADTQYINSYQDAFDVLEKRELSTDEIAELETKIVRETTPGGDVIMSYHKKSDVFIYYTDHLKDITYEILETVAQKYVIEHDCKILCVDKKTVQVKKATEEDMIKSTPAALAESAAAEALATAAAENDAVKPKERSVFATFKNYNTTSKGAKPNFKTALDIVNEQMTNHFRYRGKLKEYEDNEKVKTLAQETAKTQVMDYTTFKQMMKEKSL